MTERHDHLAQHRETDAHDVVVVALDTPDEGPAQPVDGEGTGDVQGLAPPDVRRDLLVVRGGEVHGRRRGHRALLPGGGVAQAVPGAQHAAAPAHGPPPLDGLLGRRGLAERPAVQLQHGVAAQDQGAGRHLGAVEDRPALQLGETDGEVGRREAVQDALVDAGDHDDRVETGAAQGGEPGGRGGGEDEGRHGRDRTGIMGPWRT